MRLRGQGASRFIIPIPASPDSICLANLPQKMSLSLFTQSMSIQVSENDPSPRQRNGSSSSRCIPQRQFSLASFNVNAVPTIRELYDLRDELDYQCLQTAADTNLRPTRFAKSDVNSVVGIAIFLASPLSLARFPGTFLFQEVQLRTLISCLALLHYHAVEALYPAQLDKLRTNVMTFFQQISFQPRSPSKSNLAEAIRYAPNVYLIQLVSQYLSFIRRGDSVLPSVVGPIVRIFFASVSLVGHPSYGHGLISLTVGSRWVINTTMCRRYSKALGSFLHCGESRRINIKRFVAYKSTRG